MEIALIFQVKMTLAGMRLMSYSHGWSSRGHVLTFFLGRALDRKFIESFIRYWTFCMMLGVVFPPYTVIQRQFCRRRNILSFPNSKNDFLICEFLVVLGLQCRPWFNTDRQCFKEVRTDGYYQIVRTCHCRWLKRLHQLWYRDTGGTDADIDLVLQRPFKQNQV